ncbi:Ycf66 family protein [Microcoleus sp. FACHB-672]|uniref:Ycf66 family protein n=1 Tax=Microcoleus sp. FACHB-672 TaxID=2692825 RepID=UPI001683F20D|nr:Ycf66 family protein [Microcoleus sp. FACHB-672]MBD2039506.1 hypothetical protein [Microcoleus sp. FACHB-672]
MLSYILALTVALGSFALYMAAFFFPEVHRKGDFIWSGVGLFYALVLWFCAGRITGAVLLGETASISLLGWLGWQTLKLRREVTPSQERTQIAEPEKLTAGVSQVGGGLTNLFKRKSKSAPVPVENTVVPTADIPQPAQIPQPIAEVDGSSVNQLVETATELQTPASQETIRQETPVSEEAIAVTMAETLYEEIEQAAKSVAFEEILPPEARPNATPAPEALAAPPEEVLNPESLRPTPAPDALDAPLEEVLNPEIPSVKEAFISAREEVLSAPEQIEPASGDTQPITTNAEALEQVEPASGDTQPVTTNIENMPAAAALEGATGESDTLEDDEFDDEVFEPAPPTSAKPPQKPTAVKRPQESRPTKPTAAADGGANQLLAPVAGLISTLQNGIQGLLNKVKKPKTQPERKTPSSASVSKRVEEQSPLQVDAVLEVSVVDTVITDAEIVSESTTIITDANNPDAPVTVVVEELTILTEPATSTDSSTETTSRLEAIPPNPPSPELVEAAQESANEVTDSSQSQIPIEEIAPEVELAPPAEGSDEENLEVSAEAEPEPAEALDIPPLEATPLELEPTSSALTTPSASEAQFPTPSIEIPIQPTAPKTETSESESRLEAIPPNPPSPELVEAAQESANEVTDSSQSQIPIEEIAPEVELAPPAEGFDEENLEVSVEAEPEPAEAIDIPPLEATPVELEPTPPASATPSASAPTPSAPGTPPQAAQKDNVAKVMRAGRQDPALVEPAKRSAEAKSKSNPNADEGKGA